MPRTRVTLQDKELCPGGCGRLLCPVGLPQHYAAHPNCRIMANNPVHGADFHVPPEPPLLEHPELPLPPPSPPQVNLEFPDSANDDDSVIMGNFDDDPAAELEYFSADDNDNLPSEDEVFEPPEVSSDASDDTSKINNPEPESDIASPVRPTSPSSEDEDGEDPDEAATLEEIWNSLVKDSSLLERRAKHMASGYAPSPDNPMSKELKYKLELLQMLEKASVSPTMFNSIWKWAQKGVHQKISFKDSTLNAVHKEIDQRYDLTPVPTPQTFKLPESLVKIGLNISKFKDLVYDLLTDPELMKDENLLFHNDDPFSPPPDWEPEVYMDINDGYVYRNAYQLYIKVPGRQVLMPIILFIDKTHLDVKGRLCLEPVYLTLGIFKKEVRMKKFSWRILGYIHNQSNIVAAMTPLQKAKDYHFALGKIVESLKEVQELSGGIEWSFTYKEKLYNCCFVCPVLAVAGDKQGHDMLCAHYTSRTLAKCLCHYCNCPTLRTGIPSLKDDKGHRYKLTRAQDIAKMVQNGDTEGLQALSYQNLESSMWGLHYCDPDRGINGATFMELLHAIQHGLYIYYFIALWGQNAKLKRKRKTASRGSNDNESEDVPIMEESEEDDEDDDDASDEFGEFSIKTLANGFEELDPEWLSRNGVFTEAIKAQFDALAKNYGRRLCHQSDRTFNRAFFCNGITSEAKKNGHEERCVMLLCLLIFCSKTGAEFFDEKMDESRLSGHIHLIEMMLLLEHFMRSPTMPRTQVAMLPKFIPEMLRWYKTIVNRTKGMGMNFVKFHMILHLHDDILRAGPSCSFDGSLGESFHVDTKTAGRQTQQNVETFEEQTAVKEKRQTDLRRGFREMNSSPSDVRC